jgi:hypothetical protein
MSIHPDIAITLAAQRVAEYHRLAARHRGPAISTSRPRQLLEALTRIRDRRVRSPRLTGRTAPLDPTALSMPSVLAK